MTDLNDSAKSLRIKFICCDVFARLAYDVAAKSKHVVDIYLHPMLAHNEPGHLRSSLQNAVDCTPEDVFDVIVMGYGLCGSASAGLKTHMPMIIPRMHDCSAMFLGSSDMFSHVFGHRLSTRWRTCGYMERCSDNYGCDYKLNPEYLKLLEEYGEENAQYVWETMHPPAETDEVVYIEIDGYEYGSTRKIFANEMTAQGKTVEIVKGSTYWFEKLINGPWDEDFFLKLFPGEEIYPIYDMKEVITSKKCGGNDV